MDLLFDATLVLISGCSAVYCWVLSRRLSALQNLRKGMGKAMVNLTKSVSAVETNAAKLNREATTAVVELKDMLARVDSAEGKVDDLLETMDRQAREQWKDYRAKTSEANAAVDVNTETLRELIADAKVMASLMNDQLITLAKANDKIKKAAANAAKKAATQATEKAKADQMKVLEATQAAMAKVKPVASPTVSKVVANQKTSDRSIAYNAAKAAKLAALRKAARAGLKAQQAEIVPSHVQPTMMGPQESLAALAASLDKASGDKGGASPKVAAVARKIAAHGGAKGEGTQSKADITVPRPGLSPKLATGAAAGATNPFTASAMKRAAS
ncbi:MAG: hypothetical protein AAF986_04960 [Pseudomonadota bacterium]